MMELLPSGGRPANGLRNRPHWVLDVPRSPHIADSLLELLWGLGRWRWTRSGAAPAAGSSALWSAGCR